MGDDNSSGGGSGLGCLGFFASIAGLVATFSLGPIDFGRAVYNQVVGDTPVIKRQLTDYVRSGIAREYPDKTTQQLEQKLSNELKTPISKDGKVDPMQVSSTNLWDASEDYAKSWYQRFIWPSLE